jgi:hypothetical protein
MKHKIKISKISEDCFTQKGFPEGPFNTCLTCKCGDSKSGGACCELGVHVDKESYDLIIQNKDYFEKKFNRKIEDCFENWTDDIEFLGKGGILTKCLDGSCIFRTLSKNGCEIVNFALNNNVSKRIIPTACRIYPLSWDEGELFVCTPEKHCVCSQKNNNNKKSIYYTQKEELEDVFEFDENIKKVE